MKKYIAVKCRLKILSTISYEFISNGGWQTNWLLTKREYRESKPKLLKSNACALSHTRYFIKHNKYLSYAEENTVTANQKQESRWMFCGIQRMICNG